MRSQLLGAVSHSGEKPDDELQRAFGVAHEIVGERGRGMEDLSLLLARAVVRLASHLTELSERERARDQTAPPPADGVAEMRHAGEVAALTGQLSDLREKVRTMMRSHARVCAVNERAIVLMLAMLEKSDHRISAHPEWVLELGRLSGAE